jgi:signal transduction histidine kinase
MSSAPRAMRLLSLAAHELRTPAGVIGGCLKIVRMVPPDDVRREKALSQAERNYERLVELLGEMSDLWRLEVGEAVFNRQRVSIDPLLGSAAHAVESKLTREHAIHVDSQGLSAFSVMTDPVRLERAFVALLLAAARHAPNNERLTIQARPLDGTARMRVLFSGAGDSALTQVGQGAAIDEFEGGLGLALPIARRVIEADGGAVYVLADVRPLTLAAELPAHV